MLKTEDIIRIWAHKKYKLSKSQVPSQIKFSKKDKNYIAQFLKNNVRKYTERHGIILAKFNELLDIEKDNYFDASFILKIDPEKDEKVNDVIRDIHVKKLIDLNRVFFNLPLNILCYAVAIVDRFIAKVKVKPKYMPCVTAVCLQIAVENHNCANKLSDYELNLLTSKYLAELLKCGANSTDLDRLRNIIRNKLHNCMPWVTIYDFVEELLHISGVETLSFTMKCLVEISLGQFALCNWQSSHIALACFLLWCNRQTEDQTLSKDSFNIRLMLTRTKMNMSCVDRLTDQLNGSMLDLQNTAPSANITDGESRVLSTNRNILPWTLSKNTLDKLHPVFNRTKSHLNPIPEESEGE